MYIDRVIINNFKCFKGEFSLKLNKGLNILVGDNETGKSTIIEAIHLALSGLLNGRYLKLELSQYLFNNDVINEYLKSIQNVRESEVIPFPPEILIEIFIKDIKDDSLKALFEGNGNSTKQKACGVQFKIALNETHQAYYEEFVRSVDVKSIPIEYYEYSWSSFARDERVTPSTIPIKSAFIDSISNRYRNGSDVYISRIIKDHLEDQDKIKVEQAHRKMRDAFMCDPAICNVNKLIKDAIDISDKKVELSVDLSSRNAWETTLTTYLDDVPFHHVGKGEQCIVKTKLALSHKRSQTANILLMEEPENHLTHTKLNQVIKYINDRNVNKQVIISTHSSFVANKLGLGNLIIINVDANTNTRYIFRLDNLHLDTKNYFTKLSGYDTLRLILCKKAILVEGDSDELIVQKAYRIYNNDRLPIQDQIDVISVGTAFARFLEIAEKIKLYVAVVIDNDGDVDKVKKKYKIYLDSELSKYIKICFDEEVDVGHLKIGISNKPFNYNTLEPKLLKANNLEILNAIFKKKCTNDDDMHKYMRENKTECALKIYDSSININMPKYIMDAIE